MGNNILAQLIGSVVVVGVLMLIAVFGPKIMYALSWRDELLTYEQERMVQTTTTELVRQNANRMDRIFNITNVTSVEMQYIVQQYAAVALPNASVLVAPGEKFKPRWSESNARGALLESAVLADNDLVIFPSYESRYICTIITVMALVPVAMICAAMVAAYQKGLMRGLFYVTGLNRAQSIESAQYQRTMVAREVLALAISVLYALFCLAQAAVFGYLESNKQWKAPDVVVWGMMIYTGIAHSPVKPVYMQGIPQMTSWLTLTHFCMYLHTSAAIGLVILCALRCFRARNALKTLRLTDVEIRDAMAVDHKRVVTTDASRPLYHN